MEQLSIEQAAGGPGALDVWKPRPALRHAHLTNGQRLRHYAARLGLRGARAARNGRNVEAREYFLRALSALAMAERVQ